MAERRRPENREQGPKSKKAPKSAIPPIPPIPMTPVDLLAGLAPGVELFADDVPPGIAGDDHADSPLPANTTVTEVGRQVRAGEGTVRRLIRTAVLRPATRGVDGEAESAGAEPTRAGVIDRTPDKPGE